MAETDRRLRIVISSPLEIEHVERIRAVAPDRIDVIHPIDLLPPARFTADHSGPPDFRRSSDDERRFGELIASADILWDIPRERPDGSNPIDDAKKLRWVQTTSSGVGPLVKKLGLIERGIEVTTARGLHAGPLTEFVFLALLMHAKELLHLQKEQAAHRWKYTCGDSLEGKRLSIVGLGGIGRRVAATGKAFGMTVAGLLRPGVTEVAAEAAPTTSMGVTGGEVAAEAARTALRAAPVGAASAAISGSVVGGAGTASAATQYAVDELFPWERWHDLLAKTDALVLCAPHTADTHRMLDRAAFEALRPGAVLVNIARGSLVDESAMIEALRTGRLAFAALDVFDTEPLPVDSPLWDMDNVLVSPHSASTVHAENARITEVFCHNLPLFLQGRLEEMRNRYHRDRGY